MNPKEIRELLSRLGAEGRTLRDKLTRGESLTDEEQTRFAALPGEIRQAQTDLQAAEQRQADIDLMAQIDADYNRPAPGQQRHGAVDRPNQGQQQQGAQGQGAQTRDAWVHPFFESESFRRFQRANGHGTTEHFDIGSPYFQRNLRDVRQIAQFAGDMSPEELRTIVSLTATSDIVQGTRLPGIYRQGGPRETRVRDLFFNGRTDTGIISFLVETSRTNAAAAYPETTSTGDTAKPESAVAFQVKQETAKLIAHMIPVTRQMLQDIPAMEGYLDGVLMEGLADVEDDELLAGSGVGEHVLGLKNQSNIQVLDETYFGSGEPLPSDANELDRIRRAITKVRLVGKSRATGIIAHPADVERWETMKDGDGNYLLTRGGPEGTGLATVWGRNIYENEAIDEREPIVGAFNDATAAAVWDRMDAEVFMTDSHSNWFALNLIAMLAEERLVFTVFKPKAFAIVTLPA